MQEFLEFGGGAWTRADALSLAQVVFTVLGFWVAISQLRRTATAAELTNKRLSRYNARLSGNDLLVGLPELQKIEDELDAALKKPDEDEVERCLVRYTRRSAQIIAILEGEDDAEDASLLESLRVASKASAKAKADISKGGAAVAPAARSALGKIVTASGDVSGAITRRHRKLDDE